MDVELFAHCNHDEIWCEFRRIFLANTLMQRDAHDVRCDKYFVSKLMKKNGSDFGRRLNVAPTGLMNDDESL